MTAGRDKNVSCSVVQYALVFFLDYCCAYRRFFDVEKAELFESFSHSSDSDLIIVSDKRRRKADYNGIAVLEQDFDFLRLVDDLFCILRANDEAMAAQNTFVADYISLIARKSDRFNRAVADTFIAVFAVRFFQR